MNRLEWILGILLVLLLLIVVGLSALLWLQPRMMTLPTPAPVTAVAGQEGVTEVSTVTGETARVAYAAAQREATEWKSDAVLLSMQATWPQGTTSEALRTGKMNWGYTFYSPNDQSTALVTVVEENANVISEGAYQQSGNLGSVTGWNVDSSAALEKFLNEGGAQFMETEGPTTLTMQLSTNNPNGRLEWFISLFATQSGNSFSIRMDATSGDIILLEQLP